MSEPLKLTGEERDAILAGLRLLEGQLMSGSVSHLIRDILTNCDQHGGIDPQAIDGLCERVNV